MSQIVGRGCWQKNYVCIVHGQIVGKGRVTIIELKKTNLQN